MASCNRKFSFGHTLSTVLLLCFIPHLTQANCLPIPSDMSTTSTEITSSVFKNPLIHGWIGLSNGTETIILKGLTTAVEFDDSIFVGEGKLNFAHAATSATGAIFSDGATLPGSVDNLTQKDSVGTLQFLGNGLIEGSIGASHSLNAIHLNGGENRRVMLEGDVSVGVGNVNFSIDTKPTTTLQIADGVTIHGSVDNTSMIKGNGTLAFEGNAKITGSIGETQTLNLFTIHSQEDVAPIVELNGNKINIATVHLHEDAISDKSIANSDATLLLDNPTMVFTGNISSSANHKDVVNVKNAAMLNTNMGTLKHPLHQLHVGQNSDLFIKGDLAVKDTLFFGSHVLTLADGNHIRGNFDSALSDSAGTLVFVGEGSVIGDIGVDKGLEGLILDGGENSEVIFQSNLLKVTLTEFTGPSTAIFTENVDIKSNIDSDIPHQGSLSFIKGGKIQGNLGSTYPLDSLTFQNSLEGNTLELEGTINHVNKIEIIKGEAPAILRLNNPAGLKLEVDSGIITHAEQAIDKIEMDSPVTILGNVGTRAHPFEKIDMAADTTIAGNIFSTQTHMQNDSTLIVSENSTVTGHFTTNENNKGNIIFKDNAVIEAQLGDPNFVFHRVTMQGNADNIVIFNNDIFAADINVENGSTFVAKDQPNIHGNLTISDGTLHLAANSTVTLPDAENKITFGPNSILSIDMGNDQDTPGSLNAKGPVIMDTTATVKLTNFSTVTNNEGKNHALLVGGEGSQMVPLAVVSTSEGFYFTTEIVDNVLGLVATPIPSTPPTPVVAIADQAPATNLLKDNNISGELAVIVQHLTQSNSTQMKELLQEFAPLIERIMRDSSFTSQLLALGAVEEWINQGGREHFKNLAHNDTGYVAGDSERSPRAGWVKTFGQIADQKSRGEIEGYRDNVLGLALGTDALFTDKILLGAAFSGAHAVIHSSSQAGVTTADSYQATLYGRYIFSNPIYMNWLGAVAYNDYHQQRNFTIDSLSFSPTAQYNGWQYGVKSEVGYVFNKDNYHIVPFVTAYYSYLEMNGYTEEGAGSANQTVEGMDFNMLQAGGGMRLAIDYIYDTTIIQPEFHVMAFYALVRDAVDTTWQFTGGGPVFTTNGIKPAQVSYNIGATLTAFKDNGLALTASYDFGFKKQYTSHAGYLRARYEWD